MAIEIARVKAVTNGWIGGPGLSQFHFSHAGGGSITTVDCSNAAAAVRAFYLSLAGIWTTGWTCDVQPVVQVIEATNGALIREEGVTPPAQVEGAGGSTWGPTATGILATWHTSSVFGTRMLKGHTFLTPIVAAGYNTSGQVTSSMASATQAAGATLLGLAAPHFCVWHRPHPTVDAANGGFGDVTACSVSSKEAMLRSRRD